MTEETNTTNKVPFDPGFAPYTFGFAESYLFMETEVRKFKNINQRKMKYKTFEASLFKLCDNLTSFYFCGMLYGAYLKNKYKNEPKEIAGNDFYGIPEELCKNTDVTVEINALEKFVKNNDRSPFATRKINPKYYFIVNNYVEFLEINKYFTNVKTTADIKTPQGLIYINEFSVAELDKLYEVLQNCISAGRIENVLTSLYFENIKI